MLISKDIEERERERKEHFLKNKVRVQCDSNENKNYRSPLIFLICQEGLRGTIQLASSLISVKTKLQQLPYLVK